MKWRSLLSSRYRVDAPPRCWLPFQHLDEVHGATIALWISGPWSGPTEMDCGCILTLVQR